MKTINTQLKKKFEKTRLCKEGGSSFECSDYEGIVDDMWDFIHSVVDEASAKEYQRGALMQVKLDAETVVSDRKQLEREIIKKIKTWEKTVECPLYVCCQDCYELSIDDVLDLLKKETK